LEYLPAVASVNRSGGLRVLLADGELQDPPKELK
jgi:hypothetical protein